MNIAKRYRPTAEKALREAVKELFPQLISDDVDLAEIHDTKPPQEYPKTGYVDFFLKVEGNFKIRARVTVSYRPDDFSTGHGGYCLMTTRFDGFTPLGRNGKSKDVFELQASAHA